MLCHENSTNKIEITYFKKGFWKRYDRKKFLRNTVKQFNLKDE